MELTELEQDALKEFLNIGLGMAADSLSQMVDHEILLSLPQLNVVSLEDAVHLIDHHEGDRLVAIRQNFSGELSGTALLVFPGAEGLELVRTLLGENTPLETLTELEQETLLDVGNVILNSFLSSFTQMINLDFEFDPAELFKAECRALLDLSTHRMVDEGMNDRSVQDEQVFFLMMDFKTNEDDDRIKNSLHGYIIMLFSHEDMKMLKRELERILSQF
ncbi:MAG: chemotaxis protein CheC [Magnetococcus sp. DMHC-1]|nr:chemotaxis protein CheC [Magnetococcales bacterium]